EGALNWVLEQTATNTDGIWVAAACARHFTLIPLAQKLAPDTAVAALAEEWREQEASGSVDFWFKGMILKKQVRPLYAYVLRQIAEAAPNHHTDVFDMDRTVTREHSEALEAAFRQALSSCFKSKSWKHDSYELPRISAIALRRGVPEAIGSILAGNGASPETLRADLGTFIDLPASNDEMVAFLKTNQWKWDPDRKKFQPAINPQT